MSLAAALAAVAGAAAVLAAWEALVAAERGHLVHAVGRWLAPAASAVRGGGEPSSPERRRLMLVGTLSLLSAGWLVAGPWAGVGLAAAGPWSATVLLRARRRRWRAAVAAEAPAIARALADALAGGHSVRGALAEAAHSGGVTGPAGRELRAVAAALHLGERTDEVMAGLARRAGSGPYDTLAAAVVMQRDAGGDLAGLLRSLARSLEERARVEADARSATAQARFTAFVVAGLPLAGLGLGELARPGFVIALVREPIPALLAGAALILQAVALLAVRRIARVPGGAA